MKLYIYIYYKEIDRAKWPPSIITLAGICITLDSQKSIDRLCQNRSNFFFLYFKVMLLVYPKFGSMTYCHFLIIP